MAETHPFQSDIAKLLRLLSKSLYQNREVAVRELVSNASDALDKRRLLSVAAGGGPPGEGELRITVAPDHKAGGHGTLTVSDTGVGMTKQELIDSLGTIARSGTGEFAAGLEEGADAESLIGQFGVGFYSAFMLADRIEVRTRPADADHGWRWASDGTGEYEIAELPAEDRPEQGTDVILHLREDAAEYADPDRLRHVLTRYSAFVPHPLMLAVGDDATRVNDQPPVWVEPKGSVSDEQHRQFYNYLTGRVGEDPLWRLHLTLDSPLEIRAILYCPPSNPELLGLGRAEHGLHLCAKRVLVESNCTDLLPEYLRFLHGLVDSADLPLNVSRQALQDETAFRRIRRVLTGKVLSHLDRLAESEPEAFRTFHEQFGPVLREGIATDFEHRDKLAGLLRFRTLNGDGLSGLKAYVEAMPEGQSQIFYAAGADPEAVRRRPSVEAFVARGVDVLLLADPVDEIVLNTLNEWDGKPFVSVESDEADLPPAPEEADDDRPEPAPAGDLAAVVSLLKDALGEEAEDVRTTDLLTDSACRLVTPGGGLSAQLQNVLRATDKHFTPPKRVLELNPRHPLIRRLAALSVNDQNSDFIQTCGRQLFDNALLLSGLVPDPAAYAARAERFMTDAAGAKSSVIL